MLIYLDDVAQRSGLFVVAGARADALSLGHRDLHVIDEARVEQRFEEAVGEAHHQDVLDGLLAEVVIDPEDLLLGEDTGHVVVDGHRARQIVADRLFDDHPREAIAGRRDEACARQLIDGDRKQRRRNRQVVDAITGQSALVLDDVQP